MSEIVTRIKPGDTVWWVHDAATVRVYKGVVQGIELCEPQGALYCRIYSPSFRINPHPIVHYSKVWQTRAEAEEYAGYFRENPDDVLPVCMGCHFNRFQAEVEKHE